MLGLPRICLHLYQMRSAALLFSLIALLGASLVVNLATGQTVWPRPAFIEQSGPPGGYLIDATSFTFKVVGEDSDLLSGAIARYQPLIFYAENTSGYYYYFDARDRIKSRLSAPTVEALLINVTTANTALNLETDESYSLAIESTSAMVVATTVFGAMHGLETFSQLVTFTGTPSLYSIPAYTISDAPRFPHRGFLIDTSRHYLPVSTILHIIDSLAYHKLNVLHWHAVDAVSFPVESSAYPLLAEKGAWFPTLTYTTADLQKIVNYATARGVRVIPEFDVPGHSYSWGLGYPELVCDCAGYGGNINNFAMNPASNFTFELLEGFFNEMVQIFTDPFFHIGGDEIVFGCWAEDSAVVQWMEQNGFGSNYQKVYQYFEGRLAEMFSENNLDRQLIGWQEIFMYGAVGSTLPASTTVVEVWQDAATLLEVATYGRGVRALLAYGWYLDQLQETWENFYANEPFSGSGWTPAAQAAVIGGEISAWGEGVNMWNWDANAWPRASAAAERLWSPIDVNSPAEAFPRLVEHICRLNRRNVAAAPITPGFCPPF